VIFLQFFAAFEHDLKAFFGVTLSSGMIESIFYIFPDFTQFVNTSNMFHLVLFGQI